MSISREWRDLRRDMNRMFDDFYTNWGYDMGGVDPLFVPPPVFTPLMLLTDDASREGHSAQEYNKPGSITTTGTSSSSGSGSTTPGSSSALQPHSGGSLVSGGVGGSVPRLRVDLVQEDNQYVVSAECPGVKKEDLSVQLQHGVLNITAHKRHEVNQNREQAGVRVIRQERAYGQTSRAIRLPPDVASEQITAKFDNGVLRIEIPRQPEKREQQGNIQIQ